MFHSLEVLDIALIVLVILVCLRLVLTDDGVGLSFGKKNNMKMNHADCHDCLCLYVYNQFFVELLESGKVLF